MADVSAYTITINTEQLRYLRMLTRVNVACTIFNVIYAAVTVLK